MKEHDWVGESLSNPTFTNSDFKSVGINASNTSIGPESVYLQLDEIRNSPEFQTNGRFDQRKFHSKYEEMLISYNKLASDTFNEDLSKPGKIFDYNNIFVNPEERREGPTTYMTMEVNPDHLSRGIVGINELGPRTMTPMERAEGQKIFDPATGKFTDETPESSVLSNFFKPIVMATWDYDADINGNPTNDPNKIAFFKGEYKLNPEGEYYTEFLDGRSHYDKQIVSKWNILTPEGTFSNKLDIFDSDGIDKSTGGSIMRNALKIAPFFIPQVAPLYAAASIGINLTEALGTLGKLVTGSENNTLNELTGLMSSLNQTTSEYGQQHTFSLENIINMVGDTFTFLRSQRVLAQQAPRLFMSKIPKTQEEQNALIKETADAWAEARRRSLKVEIERAAQIGDKTTLSSLLKQLEPKQLEEASFLVAKNSVQNQMMAYQNLGRQISTGTMAVTFGLHTYGHAKAQGVSDTAATALTLGAIAGQYALLSSHIGQHIFPEAQIYNKRLQTSIDKLFTVDEKTGETLLKASKNMQVRALTGPEKQAETLNFMQKGWNIAKQVWEVQSDPAKATVASSIAQGVEMMSFTMLDDVIASIYNLGSYISGSDHRMSAWEDIAGRYGTALIGGAIAGAIGADEIYKSAKAIREMNNEQAFQTIIYMINEGKTDQLFKAIDKMDLGNKYLSGTKQQVLRDPETGEEKVYWDMGTEEDNQDLIAKNVLKQTILDIEGILNSHGAKLARTSVLSEMVDGRNLLSAYRFEALLKAQVAMSYLQDFVSNQYELVKNGLLLSSNPEIRRQLGITDPMNREIKEELRDNEGKPKSKEAQDIQKARNDMQKNIEINRKYVSGEIAKEYVPLAIYELSPALHYGMIQEGFRKFVYEKENKQKTLEQLDDIHREQYWEIYKKQLDGPERKDRMQEMHNDFKAVNTLLQPILKKRLTLSSETAKQFIKPFRKLTEAQFEATTVDATENGSFEETQRLHSTQTGAIVNGLLETYDPEKTIANLGKAINDFTSSKLALFEKELNAYKTELATKPVEEQLALDESILDSLNSTPEFFKELRKLQKELNQKIADNPSDAESARKALHLQNILKATLTSDGLDTLVDALKNIYYLHLKQTLIPKFFQSFKDNYESMGFLDYTTRLNIIKFLRDISDIKILQAAPSLTSTTFDIDNNPIVFNLIDVFKNIIPNERLSGEAEVIQKAIKSLGDTYDNVDTMISQLYKLLEPHLENIDESLRNQNVITRGIDVLTIDDWQVASTLDRMLKIFDGDNAFSVSGLMSSIERQYYDLEEKVPFFEGPTVDLERFILDPNTVDQIDRIIQMISILDTGVVAATDVINDRLDMFGYNATTNEVLKLQGEDKLMVLPVNEVGARRQSLVNIILRLEHLKQISNLAQTQKLANIPKIDTKFLASTYQQIRSKFDADKDNKSLADIVFYDGTKFEGVQELLDTLDSLATLKGISYKNTSFEEGTIEAARQEFLQMGKAIREFINKNMNIVNSPEKLSAFINKRRFKNLGRNLHQYKGITQSEAPVDDMALMYLIATFGSLDVDVFYSMLAKHYPKERIPVETQHILSYQQLAHVVDSNNLIDKFAAAYNESGKYDNKGKPYDLNTEAGKLKYIDEFAGQDLVQKNSHILYIEGGPGFGKSKGTTSLTLHVLSYLAPEFLKNAWILKPNNVKEILDKADLTPKQLEEAKIKLFEGREGKLKMMRAMIEGYQEPKINPKTRQLEVDPSKNYEFDLNTFDVKTGNEIKTLTGTDKPKVIFIDEFTDFSSEEWADINKFAKKNNIKVVAIGDFFQSGIKGRTKKVSYNGTSITNGADWTLFLERGNVPHTFSGEFSLRTDNIQIDQDLPYLKIGRKMFQNAYSAKQPYTLTLHNYISQDRGVFGTVIEQAFDPETGEVNDSLNTSTISAVINMINDVIKSNGKKSIVYVYSSNLKDGDSKSPMYEFLKTRKTPDGKPYWDYITPQEGTTIKGDEAAYYIIDQDLLNGSTPLKEYDSIAAEWYTGLTRAQQGSIFVDRISDNPDFRGKNYFKFKGVTQKTTRGVDIPPDKQMERRQKYLKHLNTIYEKVVEYKAPEVTAEQQATPQTEDVSAEQATATITVSAQAESGVSGQMLAVNGSPEETTNGDGTVISNDTQDSNVGTAEQGVALNETEAATTEVQEYKVTFKDPLVQGRTLEIKVNRQLNYGVYPFLAQRTGYRTDNPDTRDGRKADGYSVCKDYRSDCVYGLRRIEALKQLPRNKSVRTLSTTNLVRDPYDIEGKNEEDKTRIINNVINTLESLRTAVLTIDSYNELLEEFLTITGLSGKVKAKDIYMREAIIKKNPAQVVNSQEPEDFKSMAADFSKEIGYGAANLNQGGSSRTNEIPRTEYVVIFGLKGNGETKNNPEAKVLLTLPIAGLPNWETIVKNMKFGEPFFREYKDLITQGARPGSAELAQLFDQKLDLVINDNSGLITDEIKADATLLQKIVKAYLNISFSVSFFPHDNRIPVSKRFKLTGPFIVNNNRGRSVINGEPLNIDGFTLDAQGVHTSIKDIADNGLWAVSKVYVPTVFQGMNAYKYFNSRTKEKVFKSGTPYVFVAKMKNVPKDINFGDINLRKGQAWTDQTMIQYYMKQIDDPNLPQLIKKISLDTPGVTVEEYIKAVMDALYAKTDKDSIRRHQDIGNSFTAYRIIQKLYDKFKDEPESAFMQILARQVSRGGNLTWDQVKAQIAYLKTIEAQPDYVEKVLAELEETTDMKVGQNNTISVKWKTGFEIFLNKLLHASVVANPSEGVKELFNKLKNEISQVTQSWKTEDGTDNVIHYNTFFSQDKLATYSFGDYSVEFAEVTNIDESSPYMMHGKPFTFRGVLMDGPALGEISSLYDIILKSFDLDAPERENISKQSNSSHTQVYDQANEFGGSMQAKSSRASLKKAWENTRSIFVYDQSLESEINEIISSSEEGEELGINSLTGKDVKYQRADTALREHGYLTLWKSSGGQTEAIYILKIADTELNGYIIKDIRIDNPYTSVTHDVLEKVYDTVEPNKTNIPLSEKISDLLENHGGSDEVKPIILGMTKDGNNVYTLAEWNLRDKKLKIIVPEGKGSGMDFNELKAAIEENALETGFKDEEAGFAELQSVVVNGRISEQDLRRKLEEILETPEDDLEDIMNEFRESKDSCTVTLNMQ